MPPKRTGKTLPPPKNAPKIGLHKATGQIYVRIAGHMHYCGHHNAPASRVKAHRLLAEAAANNGTLPPPRYEATVAELLAAYLRHAEGYYAGGTGLSRVQSALRPVAALFGEQQAADFGPLRLDAVRQIWIEGGNVCDTQYRPLRRSTINDYVHVIQAAFKWGASREMLPAEIAVALGMLSGLRKGRSKAKEPRKVNAVPDAHIEAALPHMPAPVRGLVCLQRVCGARSAEILGLRPRDIDMTGPVWFCKLDEHKTAYLGKARTLTFGPRAQSILKEHMDRKPPWAVIFTPLDSIAERAANSATHRRADQKPNPRQTDRAVNERYCTRSYAVAVERAIAKANVARATEGLPPIPRWTPHQLRHSFATEARQHFGLDAVAAALGHSDAATTQIYAQIAEGKAAEVARVIG